MMFSSTMLSDCSYCMSHVDHIFLLYLIKKSVEKIMFILISNLIKCLKQLYFVLQRQRGYSSHLLDHSLQSLSGILNLIITFVNQPGKCLEPVLPQILQTASSGHEHEWTSAGNGSQCLSVKCQRGSSNSVSNTTSIPVVA